MSSSKNDKNNAPQGASGDSPRPGLRPGTRAWARANPTADDPAAALPEAEPDHHLQDAGGDVAGAEEDTAVGTAPNDQQTCNRGDDADAASQHLSCMPAPRSMCSPLLTLPKLRRRQRLKLASTAKLCEPLAIRSALYHLRLLEPPTPKPWT